MSSVADRPRPIAWALALATAVSLAATPPAGGATRTVRLAVTASVSGELSTCGCASGPQGGLARRSARLDSLRAVTPDLLVLDAGGYASTDDVVGTLVTDSLLVYMTREGYDAVAVGDEEVAAGLVSGPGHAPGRPPHVSANLLRETDGGLVPVAARFVLVGAGEVTVGITSVVSPELVGRVEARPADLLVVDPADAARAALEEIRAAGADVAVLLAHLPEADVDAVAREVPGYDVVVVGHWPRARATHGVDAGTVYVHPGERGRYLAEVTLTLDAHGLARVAGGTHGIELTDPTDLDVARWVQRSLGDADAERRAAMLERSASAEDAARFDGAASCAACHQAEYVSWLSTPHAHAFETLEAAGMDRAGACVRCHVTSFGEVPLGARGAPDDLRGVQCEACHEVPAGHPNASPVAAVEPVTCRRCHDAENSPDYEQEAYWRRVLHDR